MDDNYSYLVIPFSEFEKRINIAVNAADELMKTPTKEEFLISFKEAKERWIFETQEMYESCFGERQNWFTSQLKHATTQKQKSYPVVWQEFKSHNDELRMKRYSLSESLKTISVCDNIKDKANTQVKRNLSMLEKASLLLEKLYLLDNDRNHLARMLLVGSGVELKKPDEAIEIAGYLKDQGLADTLHYMPPHDITITISTYGKVVYEEQMQQRTTSNSVQLQRDLSTMTSIFIVHGHNHGMKETVARSVENLGFKAVILHEMPSQGRTVIEKFSDHSDEVQYAIVLLSADDFAYPKGSDVHNGKLRPRQNVVFELGYFIGKLGRNRVFPLYESLDNFEIHSDFAGVVLVPFDNKGAWKLDLAKELKALGVDVDLTALLK